MSLFSLAFISPHPPRWLVYELHGSLLGLVIGSFPGRLGPVGFLGKRGQVLGSGTFGSVLATVCAILFLI